MDDEPAQISFQIEIGTPPAGNRLGVIALDIDGRDVPRANLVFGSLRGRESAAHLNEAAVTQGELLNVPKII